MAFSVTDRLIFGGLYRWCNLKLVIDIGRISVAKYIAQEGPSVAEMEDVRSEPFGWHCRNGYLRRADDFVPAALWFADHGPWPVTNSVVCDHRARDGRLDCQSTHSSLWLGANPSLLNQGSKLSLWRDRCPPGFETARRLPAHLGKTRTPNG